MDSRFRVRLEMNVRTCWCKVEQDASNWCLFTSLENHFNRSLPEMQGKKIEQSAT